MGWLWYVCSRVGLRWNWWDKVGVDMRDFLGWLVVLRLNVPVNNFSVMSGRSHRFLGN